MPYKTGNPTLAIGYSEKMQKKTRTSNKMTLPLCVIPAKAAIQISKLHSVSGSEGFKFSPAVPEEE